MRSTWKAALLGLTVVAVGCRQNDEPADAEALFDEIQADEYTSWERAPGYKERRASSAPHGDEVEIFVNDVVADALDASGLDAWPVGSIVAKNGYSSDGELELVAVMEKRETGWFWAEYDADGVPQYSGSPTICTDCHASGSDFVRAFSLP
ncbi:MAG: cytochrome P460 family protein [Polyangiaceae bacterium]